jgi:8-oxo-dGTP diphosphatase
MNGKFEKSLSVDCVIFGFDTEKLNVLLLDRDYVNPDTGDVIFSDKVLVGGHVFEGEDLDDAAIRILKDLTGLENIFLQQYKTFGSPLRLMRERDQLWSRLRDIDPTKRTTTVAYFSLIKSDNEYFKNKNFENNPIWYGKNPSWYPISGNYEYGYDHKEIIDEGLKALRERLKAQPIGFELLPEKFTLTQLQKLYEVVLGKTLDKRNFRKKLNTVHYLIPTNEKEKGVRHKPAQLYKFDKEKYEQTRKEVLDFNL